MGLTKKKRNLELDALKGLAILLVIIGHAIQYNISDFKTNPFFNFIYSFHMPLFIFISGIISYFTVSIESIGDSLNVLAKKFKTLVIPFLSWYFIVNFLLREDFLKESFSEYSLKIIKFPDFGLWFFWVLFLCFLVLVLIKTIQIFVSKIKKGLLEVFFYYFVTVIIMFLPIGTLGLNLLKWYFPFFISGFLLSKYKGSLSRFSEKAAQISLVLFPILLTQYKRLLDLDFIHYLHGLNGHIIIAINLSYRYLIGFVGIMVMFIIIKEIKRFKIFEKLVWLGNRTMEIYPLQFYFVNIVGTNYVLRNLGVSVLTVSAATIISLSASLMISCLLIRKSQLLCFLLLGISGNAETKIFQSTIESSNTR
ncbi:acyltransferase family protein [Paenibacillus roseipurpureus]|uniref:Acyltransferase family protein n=1 Tax=Paenibacillus roseopurpureus TaxID=2918901 RepID=A0AA96RLS7_9BACL|nr:acyltransferase family protein [Paenibacillus sp. MBLB1832]WNR43507.1 acyltransferase family protein [Paenibacillus sp. MBLB1832]